MSILVPILVFCALVFVHELGHFIFAKLARVSVVEFAIGFGPVLLSFKYGETRYSLRAIPLGGYVKMVGEDPRDLALPDDELLKRFSDQDVSADDRRMVLDRNRWFSSTSLGWRSLIVFAGPAFNILFAIVLSVGSLAVFGQPEPVSRAVIGDVMPGQPAAKAGIKANDLVLSIDNQPVESWDQLASTVRASGGKELTFSIDRPVEGTSTSERIEVKVTAVSESSELDYLSGTDPSKRPYRIGIFPDTERKAVSIGDAIIGGVLHTYAVTHLTIKGMVGMVTGAVSSSNLAGPIFIFGEAGKSARRGVDAVLDFMLYLNIGLAVLNLLPIPVLDGGHLFFFLVEWIRGAPVNVRIKEAANQVGVLLLLALMIFALGNDLLRHWGAL